MFDNNITDLYISVSGTQKKELCYGKLDGNYIFGEHEYGHYLIDFYDTDIEILENICSLLIQFKESRERNLLKEIKGQLRHLPQILADYRLILEQQISIHSDESIINNAIFITKRTISNHKFLYNFLAIDLNNASKPADRYAAITSKMIKQETERYFNTDFEGKIVTLPDELPVAVYKVGLDLTPFISLYLFDMITRDVTPEKCQNCSKPFFPMGKAIYCDRIYNDKFQTCKRIGAMKTYSETLSNNDTMREYRKAYKRYFARVRNGLMSKEEFENWTKKVRPLVDRVGTDLSFEEFLSNCTMQ